MGAVGAGCNFCEGDGIDLRNEMLMPLNRDRWQHEPKRKSNRRYLKEDRQASLEIYRENPSYFDTFKKRGKSQKSFAKMDLQSLTKKRTG